MALQDTLAPTSRGATGGAGLTNRSPTGKAYSHPVGLTESFSPQEASQAQADNRTKNAFQSLDAPTRVATLNRLNAEAKAGNAESSRKLSFLAPTATQNLPATQNFKDNSIGGAAYRIDQAIKPAVTATAKTLASGFTQQLTPKARLGSEQNTEGLARAALESTPATESGGAGGSSKDIAKTNAAPSNVNLAVQAATPGILHGAGKIAGKVITELRAPQQIAALQEQLAGSKTAANLNNLKDLVGKYQEAYDAGLPPKPQAALPAGEAPKTLALPAHATVPPDAGRVPGGGVIINPEAPAAKVVANAGKPGKIAPLPGIPGKNVTDITAKVPSAETAAKAGASLVDKPESSVLNTAPTPKSPLNTLMQQWAATKNGTATKISQLKVLNSIIEHPDASAETKQAALVERHNLVHDEAKANVATEFGAKQGMTPEQAGEVLSKGQGENSNLYQAIANHQTAGVPKPVAYDYTPPKETPEAPSIANQQKTQVHKYIGQLNKALQDTTRTPQETAFLQNELSTAQDVLAGKRSFGDVFPESKGARLADEPTPGVRQTDQPSVLNDLPTVQKGDTTRQAVVNRNAAMAATRDTFHEGQMNQLAKKVDKADWPLIRKLDDSIDRTPAEADARIVAASQSAKNPKAFLEYARLQHQDAETVFAHRDALHPGEIGHVGNYQQRFYDTGDASTRAELEQRSFAIKNGTPGYTQHRSLPEYGTLIPKRDNTGALVKDAEGNTVMTSIKPKNENPHQDYLDMIHQTEGENGAAALAKGLEEAHPGQVTRVGTDPTGRNLGNLDIPGAKGLSIGDKKLANFYNERSPTKLSTTAPEDRTRFQQVRNGYKVVNKGLKNIVLAGGLFHGLRTAMVTAGEQALSLKSAVKDPIGQLTDNLHLIGSTFSKSTNDKWMSQLSKDVAENADGRSTLARSRISGLTTEVQAVKGDVAGGEKAPINRIPGFKQSYEAVFNRQIPSAKLMIFRQATKGMDSRVPEDLAKMRNIAKGINNGLGGIDNRVSGLNPKLASAADNLILGRDLNEGIINTLGHVVKPNTTDGNIARKFVLGTSLVAAMPGLAALAATGKLKTPEDYAKAFVTQYGNPQIITPWHTAPTSTNPKGNPVTLKLPTTFISLLVKAIQPAIDPMSTFDNSRTAGIENLASARLAAIPAAAEKLATNKDFYGNPIFTGDPLKSAENVAEQFLPIPVSQGAKAVGGGAQGLAEAGLNELGFRASSSTLPQDTGHSRGIDEYFNTLNSVQKQKSAAVKQINLLATTGKQNQAARLAQEWNTSIPGRFSQLRSKYPAYDPTKDSNYSSLQISPKSSAIATRARNSTNAKKVLQTFQ